MVKAKPAELGPDRVRDCWRALQTERPFAEATVEVA